MFDLSGKVALVSGGAGGLGAAHGRVFTSAGANVVLGDLKDPSGLVDGAVGTELDVTSAESWAAAVSLAVDTFGRLDFLINNAGVCPQASIENSTMDLFIQTFSVNAFGPFLGIQAAARVMDPGSVIVNISSVDGLRGDVNTAAYSSSKAALVNLNKSAALELAPKGISVVALCPGGVETPMLYDAAGGLMRLAGLDPTKEDIDAMLAAMIPQGRSAQPEEIAEWSAFLAARGGATATGAEFVVDGGITAGGNAGGVIAALGENQE